MMLPYYIPTWADAKSNFIKKSETLLQVEFKQSGGQLHIYGADRPDLMRGPNPMGVVLDEFSVQKPQVWEEIVQPIMRANPRAWCWFLFTPRGKNHAYQVFNHGLEERNGEWKAWRMTVMESNIFKPDQIEATRQTSTAATFAQEYMTEFLEGEGSVFRNVRASMTALVEEPKPDRLYVCGVDIAKHHDYTVIAVYDRMDNRQVYQDRFNKIDWVFQKARIKAISDKFNRALVVIDGTGIGDPVVDDLQRAGVPILSFKFTSETKKDLIEKLSISIEQGHIKMLNREDTAFEFDNFSYTQAVDSLGRPTGRITYGAPEGFFDDIVIAHGLAVWNLYEKIQEKIPQKSEIRKDMERRVKLSIANQSQHEGWGEYTQEWTEWVGDG